VEAVIPGALAQRELVFVLKSRLRSLLVFQVYRKSPGAWCAMGRKGVSISDPVSDLFARIRNGQLARRSSIGLPYSRFGLAILEVMVREGYILGVRTVPPPSPRAPQYNTLQAFLKYNAAGEPAIRTISRTSIPSRRVTSSVRKLPLVNGGLATLILTTPKGVLTCAEARAENVGGEIIGMVSS
jgi:small subunit ribosomal protein S8